MEILKKIQNTIGGRWYGVSIVVSEEEYGEEIIYPQVDRFCEAIHMANTHKVLIDPANFTCPGARYAFGCGSDLKETMIKNLVDKKGYSNKCSKKLIDETNHFQEKPPAVGLNINDKPDVLIAQLQPGQTMRLIQMYQRRLEKLVKISLSSVIAVCGNVTVKALQTKDMAVSFGCEDSRNFGKLPPDRLYVGLPYSLAKKLLTKS